MKQGKCLLVAAQKRCIDYKLLRKSEVTKKSLKCTLEILLLLCGCTCNIVLGHLTKLLKLGYHMGII